MTGQHEVARQPRCAELTQLISAWLNEFVGPYGERINGVQYLSRHGDEFEIRVIYQRGEGDSPLEVAGRLAPVVISPDDEALTEAMPHRLDLSGEW